MPALWAALIALLGTVARHGRYALIAGLLAGLALPNLAMALRPWLSELVLVLLFLTAFRIGLKQATGGLADLRGSLGLALVYQLALPFGALLLLRLAGWAETAQATALLLMLAAPPVTGGPNLAILTGGPPEPAFRLLILGTALLPLTVMPLLWAAPGLGDAQAAFVAALKLLGAIWITVALAFGLRARTLPHPSARATAALDGLTAIALAVIVVGLMSALRPALAADPLRVLGWLIFALAANLGLQTLTFLIFRHKGAEAIPRAITAGNRNVALFLVALPVTGNEAFLIFLGCYQIPMYLTPILMRPLYATATRA